MKFKFLFISCSLILTFSLNVLSNQCADLFVPRQMANPESRRETQELADLLNKSLLGSQFEELSLDQIRSKILRSYIQFSREFKETPTLESLAEYLSLRPQALRLILSSLELNGLKEIKREAFRKNPKAFNLVRDMDYFTKTYSQKLLEEAKNYSRILVTTAVAGRRVNKDAFLALLKMAENLDAIIWVIPAEGKTTFLDPILLESSRVRIVTHSVRLARDLVIRNTQIRVDPQNPMASLERDGMRGETTIYGATKIQARTLATRDNDVLQHIQYTTGTISEPVAYNTQVVETKANVLALKDHMYGAIVLEKTMGDSGFVDSLNLDRTGRWNVRISRFATEEKGFSDVSGFHTANGVKELNYEVMVPGDLHILKTDPHVLEALFRMIKSLPGLKFLVAHDPFDGKSISHWESEDFVGMTLKAQKGELNVLQELLWNVAFYNRVHKENKTVKIMVPPANHNDWLSRWVRDRRFLEDPYNREIGMELFRAMTENEGMDPYQYFILKHVDNPNRMLFLKPDQSFKVGPPGRTTDLNNHGDKGSNGARGSMRSYKIGYEGTMYGHTHRYEENGMVFNIGTSTYKLLGYNNSGLNSWVQVVGLIDQYGQGQALIFKNGEWVRGKKSSKEVQSKSFFDEGAPALIQNPNEKTDRSRPRTTFEMEEDGEGSSP